METPQTGGRTEPSMEVKTTRHNRFWIRLSTAALVVAICFPLLKYTPLLERDPTPGLGVDGGVIPKARSPILDTETAPLSRRDDSPTDICTRFSHQSAIINGTLYIYGGQTTTEAGQAENNWNNYFLSMDLSSDWQISTPSLTGLSEPSGPPNVSNGYLWNSHESLYLYGGEFNDNSDDTPPAFAMWEYSALSSDWIEHSDPKTSAGTNSESGDQPVQRAAEGAGVNVPELGRGWYFGGHQDMWTTEGWSEYVTRIYLKSLIEFTFPGFENSQVDSLSDSATAGSGGVWRNVTEGGSQDSAGFPERADGLLLYVPGFGAEGILVGLAGGTNDTYTQMNLIDVYDIATSTWYKQSTSGSRPEIRVNPCAVVAAAADGSSYQVYMFGGQALLPAGNQTQYDDLWILTIPSFTWIEVDESSQSVPYGRSGHTCNIWDGQMIVVGGYVGDQLSCDSPGVYVFNTSSLQWVNQFTALSSDSSSSSGSSDSVSSGIGSPTSTGAGSAGSSTSSNQKANPFNQQIAQISNSSSPGGLEGSYGYSVPEDVISVIGGNAQGGATVTAPALSATDGPLKTGSAIIYSTMTSGGATTTATTTSGAGSGSGSSGGSDGPNVAAIIAGTIAGILFIIVCYLAFCAWLYRKRLNLYKRHVEMSQRAELNEKRPMVPGFLPEGSSKGSSGTRKYGAHKLSEDNSANGSSGCDAWCHPWRTDSTSGIAAQGSLLPGRPSDDSGVPEDLISGTEPTFWGTLLAPRRSLRVVNRD